MGTSRPCCLRPPPRTEQSGGISGGITADRNSPRDYGDSRHLRCRPTPESGVAGQLPTSHQSQLHFSPCTVFPPLRLATRHSLLATASHPRAVLEPPGVIAGPQPRPTPLYDSLRYVLPPKHTQAVFFQRLTPVCTRLGGKLRIFSVLRTLVLQSSVFVVHVFEPCRAFSVRCALRTEKEVGEGGLEFSVFSFKF